MSALFVVYVTNLSASQDYHISSSWRQRHAVMTPLFVATQMSQTQGASSTMGADVTMGDGDVRATQDVAYFTPTQQAGLCAK